MLFNFLQSYAYVFKYTTKVKTSLSVLYFSADQTILSSGFPQSGDPVNVPLFGSDLNFLNSLICLFDPKIRLYGIVGKERLWQSLNPSLRLNG